jgi:hypothetical protein
MESSRIVEIVRDALPIGKRIKDRLQTKMEG